jgi:hypothetical protein
MQSIYDKEGLTVLMDIVESKAEMEIEYRADMQ